MTVSLSPALSLSSQCPSLSCSPRPIKACHGRSTSDSLLFTPPLSPTEEQLLAFLIPDIEPSELAAYLSAPTTPVLSDVSCLIGGNISVVDNRESSKTSSTHSDAEAVYPSPVCAAAAATVVALDRLDKELYSTLPCFASEPQDHTSFMIQTKKKRCSMYAFMDSEDEEDQEESSDLSSLSSSPMLSSSMSLSSLSNGPVYVMSSRNTRKRLMLEQPFFSPDDEDDYSQSYPQLFHGSSLDEMDTTSGLTNTLALDLVLV
ncbi:hypothetical protein BGZ65_003331 [Modicella reniformis]|uniref:Uncharacterized protein n=1 Tax=Modicella reniformis TaxID=1440133 RepID=A0A9P6M9C3_9FUNG|nr:hypothetical protein BGZ65_003331 [Modicella reniformis]